MHCIADNALAVQVPYFPPLQSLADFTPDACRQLIAAASGWSLQQLQQPERGSDAGALQLHSVKSWVMSAQVAEEYTGWDDRVLLLGDAAHRCAAGVSCCELLATVLACTNSSSAGLSLLLPRPTPTCALLLAPGFRRQAALA